MSLSVQSLLALDQLLGHGPTTELNTNISNAQPGASPTFNAVSAASLAATGQVSGATLALTGAAQIGGNLDLNGAAGGASSNTESTKTLAPLADNTNGTLATISVPNVAAGALIQVTVMGMLGDSDSVNVKTYLIAVSRIAGANALAAIATAIGAANTTGATANAAVTVTLGSVGGGVTAVNTFTILAKVARSAGSSANHVVIASVQVLNALAGGVTVA